MASEFETILLQGDLNPVVKLEQLTSYDDDYNENNSNANYSTAVAESKIEFPLLVQFTAHVQQHLQAIYSESVDMKVFDDLDLVDVKPLQLDCKAGPTFAESLECEPNSAPPKIKRKIAKPLKCADCDKYFDHPSFLRRHRETVHEGKMFRCTVCNMKLAWKSNILRHMKTLHPNSNSYYPLCIFYSKKRSSTNDVDASKSIETDSAEEHKSGWFECCECNKTFADPTMLKEHWNAEHDPTLNTTRVRRKFTCQQCNKNFRSELFLKEHQIFHEADSDGGKNKCARNKISIPYQCPICNLKYCFKKNLEKHVKIIHPDVEFNSIAKQILVVHTNVQPSKSITKISTTACVANKKIAAPEPDEDDQKITIKVNRMSHSFNGRSFECYLCRSFFRRRAELKSHFRKLHVAKIVNIYQKYKYRMRTCEKCGEKFDNIYTWTRHNRRHKEEVNGRQYKCTICPKSFLERHELKRHINDHNAPKSIPCDICNKSVSIRRMKEHKFRHSGEGKSQCTVCGNFYSDTGKLSRHMRTHTGENPFECEYCHKRFRQSYNLVVHRRMHTGEYVHQCKPCKKGFYARRELRKHNLRYHGLEMGE